jgi:hypothetical protein
LVAAQISVPLAGEVGTVGATRQTSPGSSVLFSDLIRQQLQSSEGLPSKMTDADRGNETNDDSMSPRSPSDAVSNVPDGQKATDEASLGSSARGSSLDSDSAAIRRVPLDTMAPGKIEGISARTPELSSIVVAVRSAPSAEGSVRSGSVAASAESSTERGSRPRTMVDGHHGWRSARATDEVSSGVSTAIDTGHREDKTDAPKNEDRSGASGAGTSGAEPASASSSRVAIGGASTNDSPGPASKVTASSNTGRTASTQIHGRASMDETAAVKPALTALKVDETSRPQKVASSSRTDSPGENVATASVFQGRGATDSQPAAIAAEPNGSTRALAGSSPLPATIAPADPARSKTVLLPATKVIPATGRGQSGEGDLPFTQAQAAHATVRGAASLAGRQTMGNSGGGDDRPDASLRTASPAHSDNTLGRVVALDKVTVPQTPPLSSLSPLARNSGPDPFPPGALSQAHPIHSTSGTVTAQPASSDVESHQTPASMSFDRMDGAVAPRIIENVPQRLAVGVHNAGLGWVEVRTNSAAGQVSATLASGSAETHSAISGQLAPMREYLASEHVHVDTLTSERFSPSSGGHHNSSDGQSRDGDGRQTETVKSEIFSGVPSMDMDTEMLSYINVRV